MNRWISAAMPLLFGCSVAAAVPVRVPSPTPALRDTNVVTDVIPVWVDRNFTWNEDQDISKALDEWNWTLNGYARFKVESWTLDKKDLEGVNAEIAKTMRGLVIHRTLVGAPEEMETDPLQEGVLGWVTEELKDMYIVSDRIGYTDLHVVVMHELGHTLGAMHSRTPGTLMFPNTSQQSSCVDQLTAINVASAHYSAGWRFQHMNYCSLPTLKP